MDVKYNYANVQYNGQYHSTKQDFPLTEFTKLFFGSKREDFNK